MPAQAETRMQGKGYQEKIENAGDTANTSDKLQIPEETWTTILAILYIMYQNYWNCREPFLPYISGWGFIS